jgi:hypothetical protein
MKNFNKLIIILIVLAMGIILIAGPTTIRDKRITDIGLTPVLGRGYTMVTNTFQSKCLGDVKLTDPSYDFKYKFKSIETAKETQAKASTTVGMGVAGKGDVPQYQVNATVDVNLQTSLTTSTGVKEFFHHIYVEIDMDTYYASVDEAKTKMGDSAAKLLTNDDIPGFFSACGTYYVRSLGRNAKFISVFTYSDKSTQKDVAFESGLEMQIKAFAPVAGVGVQRTAKVSSSFAQTASEKNLMITTNAFGLGKNEGATLISYDIETFKAAIKDAFISMQNPLTGKVTTMEVVPWVENAEFQVLIKLDRDVPDPTTGKPMLNYKKKQILNRNGEYLAEIERADRNMMNIYYKAKICKQTVDASWASKNKILPLYQNVKIVNNKTPNQTMLLKDLYEKHLKEEEIQKLLDNEEKFMIQKAQKCIDKMLDSGMFKISWRKIPECTKIRGDLSAVIGETIDDFCMPTFVR